MNLHVSLQRETDELLRRPNLRLRIGEHLVDLGALRVLTRPDHPRLTSKAVAVLVELVRHAGSTVTRDELLDRVWKGRCPTPDVLTQAIKELRRAFADDQRTPHYIETIPKVGYRLLARVLVLEAPEGGVFVEAAEMPTLNDTDVAGEQAGAIDAPARSGEGASAAVRSRWQPALLTLGVLVLAAGALLFARQRGDVPRAAPSLARAAVVAADWQVRDSRALTSEPGAERRPRLSPDGTRIAFGILDPDTGFDRIVVRSVEPSQNVHLTPGRNHHEAQPAWSPDGMRIAFERLLRPGCTMHVASSLGGGERDIRSCADFRANYYDWTPDGRGLATSDRPPPGTGARALAILDLERGGLRFLAYDRAPDDQDLDPRYSPDGTRIAFRRGFAPYSDLYVTGAQGGTVRRVTRIASRIRGHAWTRDGRSLLFASDYDGPTALHVVDVDSGTIAALGVAPGEFPDTSRNDDSVVYEIPRTQSALARIVLPGNEPVKPIALAPSTGNDFAPAVSADGDRVVFVSDRSRQYQLWLHELASGATRPLTDAAATAVTAPRWTADGRHVVAIERGTEGRVLVEIDVATLRRRVLSSASDNVLMGAPGIDADSYLLVAGISGRDNRLELVRDPGLPQESRRLIAEAVTRIEVDAASRSVYYTTTAEHGLFRAGLDGGEPQFVSKAITSLTSGWHVVDGSIWYISDIEVDSANLHALEPASGDDRVIGRFDAIMRDLDFSVMPDRRSIIAVPLTTEDTDVGLFRLTRGDAH
jgi:Tol biopolymer transport system component/DNA-binding winged helix-turn-helix (wHTH) protein